MDHKYPAKTRRHLLTFIILSVAFTTVVLPTRVAGQDKCNRWWSDWFVSTPTPYFNSPQSACLTIESLYNQQNPMSQSQFAPEYVNDDLWHCKRDGQLYTDIYRAVRDEICDTIVFGKYSILLDQWNQQIKLPGGGVVTLLERPARGRPFLESQQKTRIRKKNKQDNGGTLMRSDLWSIPELQDIDYPCPGNQLVLNDPTSDCAPEIHHMVPQVDSKGCACGKNSFKNAIVITKKLNGELSNNLNDPRLLRIIQYFALQNNPITPFTNKGKVSHKPVSSRKRQVSGRQPKLKTGR